VRVLPHRQGSVRLHPWKAELRIAAEAVLRKTPRREVPVTRLRRGYLPGRLAGRPMGPNVDPQDPQAEQRNPPHTSGNGVSATKRGSRAATGIVVLWWQSRHETDSSPGPVIRSARVGGPVIDRYSTDGAITVAAPGRSVSNNRSSGIEAPTTSA
jgi:hypothetical protein